MKKFEISVSEIMPGAVAVINRQTGDFAKQKLKSMKPVKRKFKIWLNSDNDMCFEHFPLSRVAELESLLPKNSLKL